MSDFQLTIEPAEKIQFSGPLREATTTAELKLKNTLEKRVAFKVKCTSNSMFKIRPAVGLLKSQEEATVALTCARLETVPGQGKHYFAAYHTDATEETDSARTTWARRMGGDPQPKRIFVFFDDKPTPAAPVEQSHPEALVAVQFTARARVKGGRLTFVAQL